MSRPLSEFTGESVYIDTMVFHLFLRDKGSSAETLFEELQQGSKVGYTSVLTFDELAFRLLLARIRDTYPGSPLDHLRRDEHKLVAEFFPEIKLQLIDMQNFPNLVLLDVTKDDLTAMNLNIEQHQLRPRDALHLAAMQKIGCMDIVSHDSDFDHITEVRRYTLA